MLASTGNSCPGARQSRREVQPGIPGIYARYIKRTFDICLALLGLAALLPFLIIIFLLLLQQNGGKPLFLQKRSGKSGKPFTIIKFRSMNDGTDGNGQLLPDHLRLTPIGLWIRKTSIDEIPQLINVLKGDMSIIGPRPLLTRYLSRYNTQEIRRLEVLPGITGWAQVNGRNSLSWERKFALDVWYVDQLSFSLDIKIILLTIKNHFAANQLPAGHANEEFTGSRNQNI